MHQRIHRVVFDMRQTHPLEYTSYPLLVCSKVLLHVCYHHQSLDHPLIPLIVEPFLDLFQSRIILPQDTRNVHHDKQLLRMVRLSVCLCQ